MSEGGNTIWRAVPFPGGLTHEEWKNRNRSEEANEMERLADRFDEILMDYLMTGVPPPANVKSQEWAYLNQHGSLHGFVPDPTRFPDAKGKRADGKEHRWLPNN